ncbi:Glu/Leu/Phe/Val dehydrogenase dimerization domain-containing protein [Halothermothrix orenii]|uniref:Leucine dehydrogenase n=1 Tax=Halothermothrix orenii (strain H 168 / OCM 544 / DSM 9562) TaxID=373903 RepID=B8CVW1_HALOH|nr:Glu/Leu/Phe/Val dehydrogenase dimerization domain-containing protein [Halothermothrix orenii]ACL69430.1 Leucine dehydrogenase [Halothermothrix orenii H 168]
MEIFKEMAKEGHEQIIFFQEKKTGLKSIVAIHNTVLGPGLGGCRMWPYKTEEEALKDAMRLSKGMTYKSAIAGEDFGGAKTVIWGDPETDKSEGLFRVLGRYINGLGGRYSTGTDVGTTYDDFVILNKETPYVGALPKEYGGSGDSSIPTAYGVYNGIKACCKYKYGSDSLEGKTVAIQGLGKVGYKLAKHLLEEGCKVYGTDIKEEYLERARQLGVDIVKTDEIYDIDCDIFSPNALGAVINDNTIERLKCDIVAGAANNVLAEPRHGEMLHQKGILYAPDYVINGGGLIQVADELGNETYSEERVMRKCEGIYNQLLKIFKLAEEKDIPTHAAADHIVEERIETIATIHRIK